MSLKEKVMIVNLSISQWTARKHDKKITREVEQSHNAKDSGRFNKILIATEALKNIQKVAGQARTFHYFNTLPWGDNGDRILSSKNYFNYVGEMSKIKTEFNSCVQDFISQYPTYKEDARIRLNGMFDEADYPSVGLIKEKFSIAFSFMPIPDAEDMRIQIQEEEVTKIRQEVQLQLDFRVDNSINEILKRCRSVVSHMSEKLLDPEAVFRDSLVTNISTLIDVIPLLNFNDDGHVKEVVRMLKPLCVDPEDLRQDTVFRREVGLRAANILNKI